MALACAQPERKNSHETNLADLPVYIYIEREVDVDIYGRICMLLYVGGLVLVAPGCNNRGLDVSSLYGEKDV